MNELSKEVLIARCEAAIKQLEPCTGTAERQSLECFRIALQSLLALRERAEPVYQCMEDGNWYDTEKRLYDEVKENGNICRVLYTAPPAPVVPEGLRIALSNAGIAAPESDEMLWASQQDYIQMLVTWVKDRKPFKPAPVVPDCLRRLLKHAEGLTFGSDWNNGTAAKYHRDALIQAVKDCRAAMLQGADGTFIGEGTIAGEPVIQPYKLPSGWVAVPVEPTKEMCDIGHIGVDVLTGVTEDNEYYSINGPDAAKVYRAMLAAAPAAPGKEG